MTARKKAVVAGDTLLSDQDLEALREIDVDGAAMGGEPAEATWQRRAKGLPGGAVSLLEALVRSEPVRLRVLHDVEDRLLRAVPVDRRQPIQIMTAWTSAWSSGRRDETTRMIRNARNRLVRALYGGSLEVHAVATKVPKTVRRAGLSKGTLVVDDPRPGQPWFGHAACLEQTPPKLVWWCRSRVRRDRALQVLDLTAGSRTVSDLLEGAGDVVVASDVHPISHVIMLDARDVGEHWRHGRRRPPITGTQKASVVVHPDLIFFDPGCRARGPGAEGADSVGGLDLAVLDREEWINTCVAIVTKCVAMLKKSGRMSFLVRAAYRVVGRYVNDDQLVDDIKKRLPPTAAVEHEFSLTFANPRIPQAFVGTERPTTHHLFIARAS